MDIASTLLTKKAALIGGGTAATATAVTVPIVVTQNKDSAETQEGKKITSTSQQQEGTTDTEEVLEGDPETLDDSSLTSLDLTKDNFFDNFNKPGYCLKKLFHGIERSHFFKEKGDTQEPPETLTKLDIFSSENISNGCYTYNKSSDTKPKVRIELVAQSETEGWLWMAGLKEESGNQKLWYKEAYLKKNGDWKVVIGQEGEITKADGYTPTQPNFTSTKFVNVKDRNPTSKEECGTPQSTKCEDGLARIGYWTNNDSTEDRFMNTDLNASGNHVTPWSSKKQKIWDANNRKHFYLKGAWHSNGSTATRLIEVDDEKVPKKKGHWKDLVDLCSGDQDADKKSIYCVSTSS